MTISHTSTGEKRRGRRQQDPLDILFFICAHGNISPFFSAAKHSAQCCIPSCVFVGANSEPFFTVLLEWHLLESFASPRWLQRAVLYIKSLSAKPVSGWAWSRCGGLACRPCPRCLRSRRSGSGRARSGRGRGRPPWWGRPAQKGKLFEIMFAIIRDLVRIQK